MKLKFLRFLLPLILIIGIVGCAKDDDGSGNQTPPPPQTLKELLMALPCVKSVEEIKKGTFDQRYMLLFEQLVDHKTPAAGVFHQRVILSHTDLKKPVVIVAEGYDANYATNPNTATELTRHFACNEVVVEHRYAGESSPSPRNWNYLTTENAAADLHAVRVALGELYTGKWIATGASKGGQNTINYTMRYPQDLAAAVDYVGPICNSLDDLRFPEYFKTIGTQQQRETIVGFQREALKRRATLQPMFFTSPQTRNLRNQGEDSWYDNTIVLYAHAYWQYGWWSKATIPALTDSDEIFFQHISRVMGLGSEAKEVATEDFNQHRLRLLWKDRLNSRASDDSSFLHYYVLAVAELGAYALDTEPLADLLTIGSTEGYMRDYLPADAKHIEFSDQYSKQMNAFLRDNDPKLICIYGSDDPWSAAAPDRAYFQGKQNMAIFFLAEGDHGSNINHFPNDQKQQIWSKLEQWLE